MVQKFGASYKFSAKSISHKTQICWVIKKKLLQIFSLFIGSYTEYCSVAWHDSWTQEQTNAVERLQIVALKIILGADCPRKPDGHFNYQEALKLCNLNFFQP